MTFEPRDGRVEKLFPSTLANIALFVSGNITRVQ